MTAITVPAESHQLRQDLRTLAADEDPVMVPEFDPGIDYGAILDRLSEYPHARELVGLWHGGPAAPTRAQYRLAVATFGQQCVDPAQGWVTA